MRPSQYVVGLALALAVSVAAGADETAQPTFPHAQHAAETACTDCHANAPTSTQAGDNLLPTDLTVCQNCHDAADLPPSFAPVDRRLNFTHELHVGRLNQECTHCHTGAAQEGSSPRPAMATCMACHNGQAAPRDCEVCHQTPRTALRPASHQPGWQREHGRVARLDDTSCVPCHTVNDCQECHEGGALVDLASQGGKQLAAAPELSGASGQTVRRIHGLNFRFLHGLEARGKTSDCAECHAAEGEDFCAECHNPSHQLGVRPAWHGGTDWLTSGVGSGGGEHARLARRDLETCAACHDARGDDPTCVMCHRDRTPGKGNDPRTHAASFADDIGKGDFHDDDGAVCFTCHTRSTRGDNGFCGYCHRKEF